MIEVEDNDPGCSMRILVSPYSGGSGSQVSLEQLPDGVSAGEYVYIHKDTWPALKEAIETTFKQMDAKQMSFEEVSRIGQLLLAVDFRNVETPLTRIYEVLERGYV